MYKPYELFSSYLRLDVETGKLYWKKRSGPRGNPGSEAGSLAENGYICIQLKGKIYKAHRIVWLLVYGTWPEQDIDHFNRIKHDNRPSNLRDVSRSVNTQNSGMRKNNTSGFKGVYPLPSGNWFAAKCGKHIGTFPTKVEASLAFEEFKNV